MPTSPSWLGDEFELIRVLGRGANGWVALARHRPLDRLVAVKTIEGVTGPAVARIQREGQLLATLRRPTIVTVYQLRVTDDAVSVVMEYLPGGDLETALATGELDAATALSVLTQVADALTVAHAAGIVHRDLKPANVLLDGQGRAVLADFGLARLPGAPTVFRTSAATVTGTPQFMAPEQIVRPDAATPALDAYAFGMLSYRLLTGAYPFAAPTVADLYRHHLASPPAPPWVLRPGFPPAAAHAILQALSKDPAARLPPDRLAAALTTLPATDWAALPPLPHPGNPSGSIRSDDTGLGTRTDDTDAPAPRVPDVPAGAGTAGGAPPRVIHLPQREQWIATTTPPMPPDRRSRHRLALLIAVVAGIVAGIALFLLLR